MKPDPGVCGGEPHTLIDSDSNPEVLVNEIVPSPAYAIYRDIWQGQRRWQAYYLRASVQIEDFKAPESEIPAGPPSYARADAYLEALRDWRERGNITRPNIDPVDRLFDWSGQRRNL